MFIYISSVEFLLKLTPLLLVYFVCFSLMSYTLFVFFWGLFFFFCFYSIQLQSFLRALCNASETQVTIHNSCLNAHVGCSARHVLSHTSDMACKPFSQALGKVPVSLGQKLPLSLFVMRKSMLM